MFDLLPLAAARAAIEADRAFADPAVWITRLPDDVILRRAAVLEREGRMDRPLWGVTLAVKDNIDIAGIATTAGSPGFSHCPETTAPAVQRLLEAGAILIGKTNLDQFATGLVGTRSPYGTPRNVFDPTRVPGGSSSGSAVAVAAGIVRIALGTDTAGSGRVPAAFGNIVGVKPTLGSVSKRGVVPACRSLDTMSVFARSVDEAMTALRVITGFDPADPYSRPPPRVASRRPAPGGRVRIALPSAWPETAPGLAEQIREACATFETHTVEIEPFLDVARLLYDGPWLAERTAALREVIERRPDILHPITRAILEAGLERRTVDAFAAFHRVAEVRRMAETLFAQCDALILPTAPFCPTLAEVEADPLAVNTRLGTYTNFVNLLDLAAIAVPIGFDCARLPVGVSVIGPAWSEEPLAAIAAMLHRRRQ